MTGPRRSAGRAAAARVTVRSGAAGIVRSHGPSQHKTYRTSGLAVYPDPVQPYPPPPPAGGNRRWVPAAIIAGGIVVAGALIGGAVMLSNRDKGAGAGGSSSAATEASSTCQAWKTARTAIIAIPDLPVGWDWDTPNIDTFIDNRLNAMEKAFALFEPRITPEPADVALAAREYLEARRNEFAAMRSRTYDAEDAVSVNMALGTLNQLCGLPVPAQPR